MDSLSGCLIARLADREEEYPPDLVDEINRAVKPPHPVGPDDIYIRAMYIVSDQINSQGGRFADEELDALLKLLIDSPVMVGHKRDSLPVARNFKADKVVSDGRTWVRSYFYWLKDSAGADDLKNNIDGGIYKECSISFLFRFPECSVCGRDVRACPHIPFNEYENDTGNKAIAHFLYRQIEKVLETSLVFRGAIPDTRISDKLDDDSLPVTETATMAALFTKCNDDTTDNGFRLGFGGARFQFGASLKHLSINDKSKCYLFPHQPGLVVRCVWQHGQIKIETRRLIPEKVRNHLNRLLAHVSCDSMTADLLLYAKRGKQRQSAVNLLQLIESGNNLHRLKVRFCDLLEYNGDDLKRLDFERRLKRLSEIAGSWDKASLDALRANKIGSEELLETPDKFECDQYCYGLEVVEEKYDKLIRHIVRPSIKGVFCIGDTVLTNRDKVRYQMNHFDNTPSEFVVDLARSAGIMKGEIVLVAGEGWKGNRKDKPVKVVDVVPGLEPAEIDIDGNQAAAEALFILNNNDHLELFFKNENHWHKIAVYHYSKHMFKRGRRFIATLDTRIQTAGISFKQAAIVNLYNLIRTGKLMHLKIEKDESYFCGLCDLWLRPVLIDGQEKYLFYAGGITAHQAEL